MWRVKMLPLPYAWSQSKGGCLGKSLGEPRMLGSTLLGSQIPALLPVMLLPPQLAEHILHISCMQSSVQGLFVFISFY